MADYYKAIELAKEHLGMKKKLNSIFNDANEGSVMNMFGQDVENLLEIIDAVRELECEHSRPGKPIYDDDEHGNRYIGSGPDKDCGDCQVCKIKQMIGERDG